MLYIKFDSVKMKSIIHYFFVSKQPFLCCDKRGSSPPYLVDHGLTRKQSANMSLMGLDTEVEMPSSRNCEDDDDEDDELHESFAHSAEQEPLETNLAAADGESPKWVGQVDILLLGLYGAGASFLAAHFSDLPVSATLSMRSKTSDKIVPVCEFREVPARKVEGAPAKTHLVGTFLRSVDAGPQSFDIANSVMDSVGAVKRTLIVDSFRAASYRPPKGRPTLNPPFVRCLRNSAEKLLKAPIVGKKVYDAPNMLQGLAAQLMTFGEAQELAVSWVGTAIGFQPEPSCLEPLEAIAQWIEHTGADSAQWPQALTVAGAADRTRSQNDTLSAAYTKSLRSLASAQLRNSHLFL